MWKKQKMEQANKTHPNENDGILAQIHSSYQIIHTDKVS